MIDRDLGAHQTLHLEPQTHVESSQDWYVSVGATGEMIWPTRARLGSLLFCPDCGTLLNLPVGDERTVVCEQCAHEEPASCASNICENPAVINLSTAYENIEITTRSHPDAFPSALQQKRKTQTKTHNADEVRLKVRRLNLTTASTVFFFFARR